MPTSTLKRKSVIGKEPNWRTIQFTLSSVAIYGHNNFFNNVMSKLLL